MFTDHKPLKTQKKHQDKTNLLLSIHTTKDGHLVFNEEVTPKDLKLMKILKNKREKDKEEYHKKPKLLLPYDNNYTTTT